MDEREIERQLEWVRRTLVGNGLPGLIEQVKRNEARLGEYEQARVDARVIAERLSEVRHTRRIATVAAMFSGVSLILAAVALVLRAWGG